MAMMMAMSRRATRRTRRAITKRAMEFHPIGLEKKRKLGNNVSCLWSQDAIRVVLSPPPKRSLNGLVKECIHEMTLSVKKGIGFALTEPEEPTLGEKEKVIPQMKMKKCEMVKRCIMMMRKDEFDAGEVAVFQLLIETMLWCHEEQD